MFVIVARVRESGNSRERDRDTCMWGLTGARSVVEGVRQPGKHLNHAFIARAFMRHAQERGHRIGSEPVSSFSSPFKSLSR